MSNQNGSLLLCGLLALALVVPGARAAEPTNLKLVPPGAAGFVRVLPQELWKSEAFDNQRHLLKRVEKEAAHMFGKHLGFQPGDVERVTVIFPTFNSLGEPFPTGQDPEQVSAVFVVTLSRPYRKDSLLKSSMVAGTREKSYQGISYLFHEGTWSALHLLDDRTFLYGSEDAVLH